MPARNDVLVGFTHPTNSPSLSCVTKLHVNFYGVGPVSSCSSLINGLLNMPMLKNLKIGNCNYLSTEEGISDLIFSLGKSSSPKLNRLSIVNSSLSDACIAKLALCLSCFQVNLDKINLANNLFSDIGFKYISELISKIPLKYLNVTMNHLTILAFYHLANSLANTVQNVLVKISLSEENMEAIAEDIMNENLHIQKDYNERPKESMCWLYIIDRSLLPVELKLLTRFFNEAKVPNVYITFGIDDDKEIYYWDLLHMHGLKSIDFWETCMCQSITSVEELGKLNSLLVDLSKAPNLQGQIVLNFRSRESSAMPALYSFVKSIIARKFDHIMVHGHVTNTYKKRCTQYLQRHNPFMTLKFID